MVTAIKFVTWTQIYVFTHCTYVIDMWTKWLQLHLYVCCMCARYDMTCMQTNNLCMCSWFQRRKKLICRMCARIAVHVWNYNCTRTINFLCNWFLRLVQMYESIQTINASTISSSPWVEVWIGWWIEINKENPG